MTTVVTRLYPDAKTAKSAVAALKEAGLADSQIDVIEKGGDMAAAEVPEASAKAYAAKMDDSTRLVVARMGLYPAGQARMAIRTMNGFASIDAGVANENAYVSHEPNPELFKNIDGAHSHFFFKPEPGYSTKFGMISHRYGFGMLTDKFHTHSVIERGHTESAIKGGRLFTGTVESLNRRGLVAGGRAYTGTVFSDALNWKTSARFH